MAGADLGAYLDANEVSEAIDRYEAAPARLRAVRRCVETLSRQPDPLLPLVRYPAMRERIVSGLRAQAQNLRDNGQLVVAHHAQLRPLGRRFGSGQRRTAPGDEAAVHSPIRIPDRLGDC